VGSCNTPNGAANLSVAVAFLSDPWGVATGKRRRYAILYHSVLHFYLTRGELQLATKKLMTHLLKVFVAFLSDPWGVATLRNVYCEFRTDFVAFLSDPWGVATQKKQGPKALKIISCCIFI